ncbi:hypothetical Protein YC6258_03417 [Gynuella sunshinyii YC6258]|uniref:Uncharacterized protein n=1 Tax=Gynuella sunshinyii YC6258 TaxID=1445510 RepID=A0A0C5VPT7_9GAMM|nr:hypothetical Protein YC6258_03417 [Gynuella sunshinyii YC6258]
MLLPCFVDSEIMKNHTDIVAAQENAKMILKCDFVYKNNIKI